MTHLGQLIAVQQGEQERTAEALRELKQQLGDEGLLTGLDRRYRPRDAADTEELPHETKQVQVTVADSLEIVRRRFARLWDLAAAKELTNTQAFADVVVGDTTLLQRVPAGYLLFLERELGNLRQLIASLPTLDPAVNWEAAGDDGVYVTPPIETTRTKKTPKAFVAYEATEAHPAQVQVFTEDAVAGYWTKREFSGMLPRARRRELLDRIDALARAVRFARETANQTEVEDRHLGQQVLDYLLT